MNKITCSLSIEVKMQSFMTNHFLQNFSSFRAAKIGFNQVIGFNSQLTFTFSKSTIETLEEDAEYVQS